MRRSQAHSSRRPQFLRLIPANHCAPSSSGFPLSLLIGLLLVVPSGAQNTGTAETEFYGKGVAISVVVHSPSGQTISSLAVVRLFRGTIPAGQAETTVGRAELVVNEVGDFTVVVQAGGYANAQKDFTINSAGRAEVDVYLQALSANTAPVPGRPVLAPKAKKAVDEGLQALGANNLAEAQKHASQAMQLAPGHPDVLYLQGVIFLKQRDWSKAQEVLEKAIQVDPSHANAFAALGMALCDQGKYEAAVAPLEKALHLNPALASWDTRSALAKAYYQQARYDQALRMSQEAWSSSKGKAPEIELLVVQSLTAVGRYEDAAQALREFLRDYADRREAATARRWLDRLAADGKIHTN
jgi:Tfp pilus assembly protein PilF